MLSGILARDALRAADRRHRLEDGVLRDAALLEQARPTATCAPSDAIATKQVLGADVLVLQPLGFLLGRVGDLAAAAPTAPAASRRARAAASAARRGPRAASAAGSAFILRTISGTMPSRCSTSVSSRCSGVISGMSLAVGELLRGEDRFLCLLGVLVDVHVSFQLPAASSQLSAAFALQLSLRLRLSAS